MFTDVVGYSSVSSMDERRALKLLDEHRRVLQAVFPRYGGTVVKTLGDGYLVEFSSAVEAVNCAVDVQAELRKFNSERPEDERVMVRIGIHVGDVVHSAGDVLGDAVNVAARVQPMAEPGGICLTRQVVDQVERKVNHRITKLGTRELKNIRYPVELYKVEVSTAALDGHGPALDPRRLAVLPFANMSPDPNDRYFADGMTEELISTASKIGELQVISRTSVMRYRDTTAQVSQIGQELSVGSILEGSVRKAGNKVRITAQLVEVESDRHVWSQSYDRDLTDVFAIQADIAEQVANSLKIQLLSKEKQSIRKEATSNQDAYTLYLKGRYYWGERTETSTRSALKYFEEAAKLDLKFAMAYSGIADAYNILSDYGWMAPAEALPLAKSNAAKAIELDVSLAEGHASLGLSLSNFDWDMTAAERELKLAIELKPNYAPAMHWLAVDFFYMRRYEECFETDRRALSLDPYSRLLNMTTTNQLLFFQRYDEALKKYAELITANPDMSALRYWRSISYVLSGMNEEAVKEAEEFVRMEGRAWTSAYSNLHLAWVYASVGRSRDAEKLVQTALSKKERSFSPTSMGWVKVLLGQKDEGYRWLERAFGERDPALLYFNGSNWSREVRADPRWKAIEAKFPFRSADD
jgi:TolB-like protein/Tfp pilus assembly protein PilF